MFLEQCQRTPPTRSPSTQDVLSERWNFTSALGEANKISSYISPHGAGLSIKQPSLLWPKWCRSLARNNAIFQHSEKTGIYMPGRVINSNMMHVTLGYWFPCVSAAAVCAFHILMFIQSSVITFEAPGPVNAHLLAGATIIWCSTGEFLLRPSLALDSLILSGAENMCAARRKQISIHQQARCSRHAKIPIPASAPAS